MATVNSIYMVKYTINDTTSTAELKQSQHTSYEVPQVRICKYHGQDSKTGSLIKLLYTLGPAANLTGEPPTLSAQG